jgi:putative transposase
MATSVFDHWACWNRFRLDFSRPGKPVDNAFVEAFNASVRRECLSQRWFLSLEEAEATLGKALHGVHVAVMFVHQK